MRCLPFFLAILLGCGELLAQDLSRLDPGFRVLERTAEPAVAVRPALPGQRRPAGLLGWLGRPGPLRVDVGGRSYVRTLARLEPGGEAALERHGARIGVRAGDVVTALVPVEALRVLVTEPGIAYLEAAKWLTPAAIVPAAGGAGASAPTRNEEAVPGAGLARLRQRQDGTFLGLAGQGVIIGVYDTGLDLSHPDFLGADGGSRVLFVWDQTAESGAAEPPGLVGGDFLGYGHECDAVSIAGRTCPMRDVVGHGTHVTGIAAGTGAAAGQGMPAYRFTGAAPAAELIVVKGGDQDFSTDRLVEGVAYIFRRAEELGRPAVVNISLGSTGGPHDGMTLFEQALDALAGPGRLIVSVAGNLGANGNETPAFPTAANHAQGVVAPGLPREHALLVPQYEAAAPETLEGVAIELWYSGRDSLSISVETPAGQVIRAAVGDTALLESAQGAVFITNGFGGPEAINDDHSAHILFYRADPLYPLEPGRWRILIEGDAVNASGDYHMWLVGSSLDAASSPTLEGGTVNSHLATAPGTASRVLAVAAHASRHAWLATGGTPNEFPFQEELGDLAFFSSPGPRRDRVLKPEISAPGKVVVSAMAADALLWQGAPWLIEQGGHHAVLLGTSMAAPVVTGGLSLLLQLEPGLTPETARALLAVSARQDRFTVMSYGTEFDGVPNPHWGYGKLDVEAAVHQFGLPAGRLSLEVRPVAGLAGSSARGQLLPLFRLSMEADSLEAIALDGFGFEIRGAETETRLLLLEAESQAGDAGGILRSSQVTAGPAARTVVLPGPVVPAGMRQEFVVALEMTGLAPNLASFEAVFLPTATRSTGTLSGARDRIDGAGLEVTALRQTTLLQAEERLNLSANPVRGDELVVNYAVRPQALTVFTAGGEVVRSFKDWELGPGQVVWDLTNGRGVPVANGVYLLVLEGTGGRIVEKFFVVRP